MRRLFCCVSLALASSGCGPLVQLSVQSEHVCHKSRQRFQIPQGSASVDADDGGEFLIPLTLPADSGATFSLRLGTVTLTHPQGVNGFGFISRAQLQLLPPSGSAMDQTALIDFEPSGQGTQSLELTGDRDDLAPYIQQGSVRWTAQLSTDWQPPPFEADVELCGEVGVAYQAL